jgi:hypothetical protein
MDAPISPGIAVDAHGLPAKDPTENVIALTDAGFKRDDDLRSMQATYLERIADIRSANTELVASIRETFREKLAIAESGRLDAIRLVDTGNVARAAGEQEARANTLASTVVNAADAVQKALEAARVQTADTLQAVVDPIKVDIADLRRVQYEQAGKRESQTESRTQTNWGTSATIAIVGTLIAISSLAFALTRHSTTPTPAVVPACATVVSGTCVK